MIVHNNEHYYALWLECTDAFTIYTQPSHNDHALHVRLNTLYNMHTHTHTYTWNDFYNPLPICLG